VNVADKPAKLGDVKNNRWFALSSNWDATPVATLLGFMDAFQRPVWYTDWLNSNEALDSLVNGHDTVILWPSGLRATESNVVSYRWEDLPASKKSAERKSPAAADGSLPRPKAAAAAAAAPMTVEDALALVARLQAERDAAAAAAAAARQQKALAAYIVAQAEALAAFGSAAALDKALAAEVKRVKASKRGK
jgi:hypothetical protein